MRGNLGAVWAASLGLFLVLAGPVRAAETPAPGAPAAAPAAAPAPADPPLTEQEKADAEVGKKAAAEIEKEVKVLDKYPGLEHVQEVVERVRPFTDKPTQKYIVKVVDNRAINAFSLPGGYIYFTKALLEAVESDDELAAVAAHEMGHICLNHSRQLMQRDERYGRLLGPLVLAAILGQKSSGGIGPGEVAVVGNLIKMDAVNHYGRAAELEADHAAVRYLYASKLYSPVAVLTVVEGLAHIDASQPQVDMGVYQTHPLSSERVEKVEEELTALHVPIERNRVRKGVTASAKPVTVEGKEVGELRLDEQVVFQPAVEVGGLSPIARAQQSADLLNPMLLGGLAAIEISTVAQGDSLALRVRGETLLTVTPGDAAFHRSTTAALAQNAMKAIQAAFYADFMRRAY